MYVRQMLVSDIDRVYDIACMSLDEAYVREVFFFFIKGWPAGQLVAVSDVGEIIGFLSGARLTNDKVTIPLFAVAPGHRRAGAGSKLMEGFRTCAMMDGRHYIQLEVRDSNKNAISFYEKIGFTVIEHLDGFYNDGGNAVRMMCGIYRNA